MTGQAKILCVDDEKNVLKALERLFLDSDYEIITATSGAEGLDVLKNTEDVQIVMSDYRMPQMNGVDFLKEVYRHWPETVRMVLSGYADTVAIVEAINEGHIYKFIAKPWNDDDLKVTIANAVERYFLYKKNKELTEQLRTANEELQVINNNLEGLVEQRTAELKFQNMVLQKSQNILDALPVAVLGIDSDGLIVLCNKRGLDLFGRGNKNVLGGDKTDILSKELNEIVDKLSEKEVLNGHIIIDKEDIEIKGTLMKHDDGQEGIVLVLEEVRA